MRRQLYSTDDDRTFFDWIQKELRAVERRLEDGRAVLSHLEGAGTCPFHCPASPCSCMRSPVVFSGAAAFLHRWRLQGAFLVPRQDCVLLTIYAV